MAHCVALEADAVLLEVGGDVLAGEPLDVHEVQDGRRHGLLDADRVHSFDETLVQLQGGFKRYLRNL